MVLETYGYNLTRLAGELEDNDEFTPIDPPRMSRDFPSKSQIPRERASVLLVIPLECKEHAPIDSAFLGYVCILLLLAILYSL